MIAGWLAENAVGLLGVIGALTVAAVAVFRARNERRADRATVRGERAIETLELLYDAIAVVDSEDRIIEANQQLRFVTGYSEKELLGMHVNDLLPPRFRKAHLQHTRNYHNSPYPRQMGKSGMTLYLLDKSGTEKRVQISLRPKEGATDGPETILCIRTVDQHGVADAGGAGDKV